MLEATRQGRIPLPRSLRPDVPPALAAVCMKALSREPGQRYPTALALAQEIENYLADQPVTAYPEPWSARVRRWVKRHRLLVTTGSVVLVLSLLSLVALVAVRQEEQQKRIIQTSLPNADLAWQRGRWAEARNQYDQVIALGHLLTPAQRLQRARILDELGEVAAAKEELDRLCREPDLGALAARVTLSQGHMLNPTR